MIKVHHVMVEPQNIMVLTHHVMGKPHNDKTTSRNGGTA